MMKHSALAIAFALAVSLPEHTVVPYVNVPKSEYPLNTAAYGAGKKRTKSDIDKTVEK